VLCCAFYGVRHTAGLGYHFDSACLPEERAQAQSDDLMIVNKHQSDV
jgi:hypothetical protein